MLKRIITGLIALPIFVFFVLKGGLYIFALTFFVATIGLYEFYEALKHKNIKSIYWLGYLSVLLVIVGIHFQFAGLYFLSLLYITSLVLLVLNLFSKRDHLIESAVTLLGVIYVGIGFAHFLLLNQLELPLLLFVPFLISWGTDTFAYFTGRFFGRRKLFPRVSPKKTIEGAVGGIIGSVLINYIYVYFFLKEILAVIIIISFFGSILSQIGDLIASKIKRTCDIKDFGYLLPGHGGIIDRFDSSLVTIPFVYYCVYIFMNLVQ